jgi:hypothetical protein
LILTKIGRCWLILVELPKISFHEKPFNSSQVVTCDEMDKERSKLIVAVLQLFD